MGLGDITETAVKSAIAEYDAIGVKAFRSKYGVGPASNYVLVHDDNKYDAGAIACAAHGSLAGSPPLRPAEFISGDAGVVLRLRQLGFRVFPIQPPAWVRDEVILACDLVAENGWKYMDANDARVLELSALLQRLPFHAIELRGDKFRNPNGVALITSGIATHHPEYANAPTHVGALFKVVLREFLDEPDRMHAVADAIRQAIANETLVEQLAVPFEGEDAGAVEGRLLQRQHFIRERDRTLRRKKIAEFSNRHGSVWCEVCRFDFELVYGPRGHGTCHHYMEVHHVLPLHVSGQTKTALRDLILLCANCHRMVHLSVPWLTPEGLRKIVAENQTRDHSIPGDI